jgi:hypothetical protein
MLRLPNLIGVGVEKCGTTLLHNILSRHPKVLVPRKKELFFFNENYDKGLDWYLDWYDDHPECLYKADITPSYFRNTRTLRRISTHSPDARILVAVRHPVERAFSHYVHRLRHVALQPGGYHRSFWDEFESGEARGLLFPHYGARLRPLLDFFPRSRILVMIYERDITGINSGISRLLDFLELESEANLLPPDQRVNAGCLPKFAFASERSGGAPASSSEDQMYFCHAKGMLQVDRTRQQEMQASARSWTCSISADDARRLYQQYFASDMEAFARDFDVDISCWQEFQDIEYPVAKADWERV